MEEGKGEARVERAEGRKSRGNEFKFKEDTNEELLLLPGTKTPPAR